MRLGWRLGRALCLLFGRLCWGARGHGAANVPARGGVILAANHQSFFDPPLVSMWLRREAHFMARSTLFRNPLFRKLIVACNAFPIEREARDVKGVRIAIERLRSGGALLVFPEGTRTRDGGVGSMKGGLKLLAARSGVPVVPVLIEGAHKAWPRDRALPLLRGRIDVAFGRPFVPDPGEDPGDRVRREILELRDALRRSAGGHDKETHGESETGA